MGDTPFLLMVGGPNGSGKTTLTSRLRAAGVDLGSYINADDIAATLAGDYGRRVRRAQVIADEERAFCISNGVSFSFETVMSHASKIDVLKQAKSAGFRIGLYFVATESVDLNVARVAQRVALGGHSVPEPKIRERYDRTLGLLRQAVANADEIVLFDNSFGQQASGPAVLRPFCHRRGEGLVLHPPIPKWARQALGDWLPPLV